ncbi:TIGR03089 family protein [Nakamurella antarctica]|uniref:TIGR03089 family protein n=1 Tax=Nakamurella antarctica TaxID=1902245 RepID=A0A3G8ZWX6_9ACTN|nr:TIGR03089 family protein [Nakamurella antarctica]AZI58536.1 TIGR03089 family protein [Nakamurella antarctica]
MTPPNPTVAACIAAMAVDPSRPRLTFYSVAGDRTELSGTVLLNWGAKVAGLLIDELGARIGDTVAVMIPDGWQKAGILLGAWWAGMVVTDSDDAGAAAAFVAQGEDASCDEIFVVSGHPFGFPSTNVAAHQRDYTSSVQIQADQFMSRVAVPDTQSAVLDGLTVGAAGEATWAAAEQLSPTDRVLTVGPWSLTGEVFSNLWGPIAAGAQVIHCADAATADLRHRAVAESATVTIGVTIAGVPRLR